MVALIERTRVTVHKGVARPLLGLVFLATLSLGYGCALRAPQHEVDGALMQYVGQMRELGVHARPPQPSGLLGSTVEAQDPVLSAALSELAVFPGPAQHRRVAERFRTLRILDAAYDHFASARTLDPTDAAAYEGLARIWRDWGFPHLGLGDASRSVYYAPAWAPAHNTLGTILAALGRGGEARRAYERARELDPRAAYIRNNLCYLSFLEGQIEQAIAECRAAVDADPDLKPARNNLALAYAAAGRDDLAEREFLAAGTAAGQYNIGIVHLAERQYAAASKAFEAAQHERPSWAAPRERGRQTRALAAAPGNPAP